MPDLSVIVNKSIVKALKINRLIILSNEKGMEF